MKIYKGLQIRIFICESEDIITASLDATKFEWENNEFIGGAN